MLKIYCFVCLFKFSIEQQTFKHHLLSIGEYVYRIGAGTFSYKSGRNYKKKLLNKIIFVSITRSLVEIIKKKKTYLNCLEVLTVVRVHFVLNKSNRLDQHRY